MSSPFALGADTFVHTLLMRDLDRSRFEVHVASTAERDGVPAPAWTALSAIPDVHLRPAFFGPSLVGRSLAGRAAAVLQGPATISSLAGLAGYVRRAGIDVLHASDRPRDAISAVLLARLTGAKSLIHLHVGFKDRMSPASRWSMRHADRLVGVSRYVSQTIVDGGHAPERTRTVLNAIDLPRWDPAIDPAPVRRELGIPPGAPVVISVGRLMRWKGQADVIRALALVRRQLPDARLLVVGEDDSTIEPGGSSYKAELQQLTRALGLEGCVTFTGLRQDVPALMAAADVFALPSTAEPFGLVYAEAMAMKRPVVALDSGGAPEVVEHGRTGLLSKVGDLDGLAAHLLTLLRDPALRASYGEYGRKTVECRFASGRMAADFGRVYEELRAS